jgi:hypothetical protein
MQCADEAIPAAKRLALIRLLNTFRDLDRICYDQAR